MVLVKNLILDSLCENVKEIYKLPSLVWKDGILTDIDKENIKREGSQESPFDPLKLKQQMYNDYENGVAKTIVKETMGARVVIISSNLSHQYPFETWGKIFQWMGRAESAHNQKSKANGVWQIYIFASDSKRVLPESGPLNSGHVNGGYTMPCSSDCVVIYRHEESTRVLIHELLHASCTDDNNKPVQFREAATEAWAELFLIALLSKGDKKKASQLWNIQSQYMKDLNYTVRKFHSVNTIDDYASRYTIFREGVFHHFGVPINTILPAKRIKISRFTSPLFDTYLE